MKTVALVPSLVVVLASACFAQAPADAPPEKAAIVANARAYEAAYAKADVAALANFFADDAEYTADDGRSFSGRPAIEEALRTGLRANKGSKLAIAVNSVSVLAPEVVLEKGATSLTAKDGSTSGALYTAIHTKKDGKWKIGQLVETPLPVATPGERLAELSWLIGEWEESDKTNDLNVRSQFVWSRGGNFITRNVTVKKAGETTMEGWQIIGWDPLEERIRSWTFDGEGGFGEGTWTREGDRWLLRETGVAPDGTRTSADSTFTKVSADRFAWESQNRTLDGAPQPSIGRIEINRVKGN
jgi:uncharacterized protein (TIGR02246 family)